MNAPAVSADGSAPMNAGLAQIRRVRAWALGRASAAALSSVTISP